MSAQERPLSAARLLAAIRKRVDNLESGALEIHKAGRPDVALIRMVLAEELLLLADEIALEEGITV